MNLSKNIEAVRAHGTISLDLADGRTATIEIDFDLSGPRAAWGFERDFADGPRSLSLLPSLPIGQKLSIYLPEPQPETLFTIRIPVEDE